MTVSRGAAGKAMVMFISSICSRSTGGRQGEYREQPTHSGNTQASKRCQLTNEDEDLVVRVAKEHGDRQRLRAERWMRAAERISTD